MTWYGVALPSKHGIVWAGTGLLRPVDRPVPAIVFRELTLWIGALAATELVRLSFQIVL